MLNHIEPTTALCAYDGNGNAIVTRKFSGKCDHDGLESRLQLFVAQLTNDKLWGDDVTAVAQSVGGNPCADGFIVEVTYGADTENNYMRSVSTVSMEPLLKGVDY